MDPIDELKQNPELLENVIEEELEKLDKNKKGFVDENDIKTKYGNNKVILQFFMDGERKITYETYSMKFKQLVNSFAKK